MSEQYQYTIVNDTECCNCHRRQTPLKQCSVRELKKHGRLKYSFLSSSLQSIGYICQECHCYFFLGNKTPQKRHYWPAMTYHFLFQCYPQNSGIETVSMSCRWKYIPTEWRIWWEHLVLAEPEISGIHIPPLFVDKTEEFQMIQEDLKCLHWLSLANTIDKFMAHPTVHCPWGCSEFLHACNYVHWEEFLFHASNYQIKMYGSREGRLWTDSMNPSFPKAACILEHFYVYPTIVLNVEEGPIILTCRHHNKKTTTRYLHVPESPFGSIYSPNSNQYAPVVMKTRCIRRMKKNQYSDTFSTAMLQGGYDGYDSSYITSKTPYQHGDKLSNLRDALSVGGRDDIGHYVANLHHDNDTSSFLPEYMVNDIINHGKSLMETIDVQSYMDGATYIDIETALNLQEKVYTKTGKTIRIYKDEDDIIGFKDLIEPPWPPYLFFVHPCDGYGERFRKITMSSNGGWILLGLLSTNEDIWEAVSNSVHDNLSWEGHWLKFACKKLKMGSKGMSYKSKHVFKTHKENELCNLFPHPLMEIFQRKDFLHDMFKQTKFPTVQVIDETTVDANILPTTTILLQPRPTNELTFSKFELRTFIIVKEAESIKACSFFSKHYRHAKWWVQEGRSATFAKSTRNAGDSMEDAILAIYNLKEKVDTDSIRRRYLTCLGGQTTVYCGIHKIPLVTNAPGTWESDNALCICKQHNKLMEEGQEPTLVWTQREENNQCSNKCNFVCPHYTSCHVGVCSIFQSQCNKYCKKISAKETPNDHIVSITNETGMVQRISELRNILASSDRAYIHAPDAIMEDGVNEKMIGPIIPHDIAEDLLLSEEEESLISSTERTFVDDGENSDVLDSHENVENNYNLSLNEHIVANHEFCDEHDSSSDGVSDEEMASNVTLYESQENHDANSVTTDNKFPPLATNAHPCHAYIDYIEDSETKAIHTTPLYVLMNHQGHLLVRRNFKLRMSKRNSAFYQRIVAKEKSKTISLVYAEAMLFPDIFWYSRKDGSIPGALPTALWSDCNTLRNLGIASMRDHARTRLHNPALLCSTDTRYHFLQFDMLLNLGLRGKDSRLVLHRGFADHQGEGGVKFRENSDGGEVYGDPTENRANVHKLAALVAERKPHYFFTQSCNQQTCKGLRILRAWITSQTATDKLSQIYGISSMEASSLLRESAAPYILRSWNEVIDLWMKYIVYSPEAPLHEIEYAWWRKEFQDKQGNPSHVHAILRTKKDISQQSQLQEVLQKIRGSLADLLHYEEMTRMINDGLLSSTEQYHEILTDALRYLTHQCNARCQVTKMLDNGQHIFICKAPNNYSLSHQPQNHTIQEVEIKHTKESLDLLEDLGMIEWNDNSKITYTILEKGLRMERHIPICSKYNQKFSPTNGGLFVRYPSAQNLQFCTGHSISSYLVKYVSGIDEVALVRPKPIITSAKDTDTGKGSYNGGEFKGTYQSLKNTKISSNDKKQMKVKSTLKHHGRPLTQMECLTVIDGCDLVTSTVEFIHMPTSAREYRVAFQTRQIKSFSLRPQDEQTVLAVVGQTVRNNIPNMSDERKFTTEQIAVIRDELQAPLSIDAATMFSIRPPELRFVNEMKLYLKWFVRKQVVSVFHATKSLQYCTAVLHKDIMKSEWLDGLNFKLVLRKGAIEDCLEYAENAPIPAFGTATMKRHICGLLRRINRLHYAFELGVSVLRHNTVATARIQYKNICEKFLHKEATLKLPTVWSTPVYPKSKSRFLIHLLLSFGKFTTEYELMKTGNIRAAYIHAKLLNPQQPHYSIDQLLKRYVREMLMVQPGSTFQFDRNLCAAHGILSETLFKQHWNSSNTVLLQQPQTLMASMETPAVLYSRMREQTNKEVEEFLSTQRNLLVETLLNDLCHCGFTEVLPSKEALILKSPSRAVGTRTQEPTFFPPPQSPKQSNASYEEQTRVMKEAKNSIDSYCLGKGHKNLVIVGGPGNGKTTVAELITLYALYEGLIGIPSSIVADRAKQLGGIHVHQLCCIKPGNEKKSPGRMAENAIATIYRHPELLHFWRTVDFLFFDELGLFSAEMLATVDIVVRYCRDSSSFFGGLLCFGSLDILQLMPFHGTPFMLSMNVITDFHFRELTQSVRAANDLNLQRICQLTRTKNWSKDEEDEFQKLILNNCKFVDDFNDTSIPQDAVYVFGKKAPCQFVEEIILEHIQQTQPSGYIVSTAYNEESSTAGNWRIASTPVRKRLSNKIKEKQELPIFERGRYEFTYNEKGRFQQGQLAIVILVDPKAIKQKHDISVMAALPGCKEFPSLDDDKITECTLKSMGWKKVKVPYRTTQSSSVFNGIIARRTQYGLRLRVATTIHASMGSTLATLVTSVTNDTSGTRGHMDYSLWEAAQVVVLLSRTRECKNIYFVGEPVSVVTELLRVLKLTNRFLPHIRQLLSQLCSEVEETPILQMPLVFRPCDIALPKTAAVYLLVSTVDVSYLYIGETKDIRKRLNIHNSYKGGSKVTNDGRLQPWAVMGYATGFRNRCHRLSFESKWKKRFEKVRNDRTAERVLSIAHEMASEQNSFCYMNNEQTIRVVRCGTVGFI